MITRYCITILAVTLTFLAIPAPAQQTNLQRATMTWNGQNGPPWPIVGVPLQSNGTATLTISSGPTTSAPFALATAGSLSPFGLPVLSGSLLDLDPATAIVIWDPTVFPQFNTGPSGTFTLTSPVPALPTGLQVPYQAAVYDPTAPTLVRLTAATEILTVAGNVIINHALGDESEVVVNLAPYGIFLSFYGTLYDKYYVGSNGVIGYAPLSSSGNYFYSQPSSFTSNMPRVALLWTDLSPNQAGTVTSTIDMSSQVVPICRVDFVGVPDYGTGGPAHTMAWVHWATPADFVFIEQSPLQQASQFTALVGITKGAGGGTGGQVDLTAVQNGGGQVFGPGVPIFEWFGYAGQTYYSGPTNTFDLFGRIFQFIPVAGGYQML